MHVNMWKQSHTARSLGSVTMLNLCRHLERNGAPRKARATVRPTLTHSESILVSLLNCFQKNLNYLHPSFGTTTYTMATCSSMTEKSRASLIGILAGLALSSSEQGHHNFWITTAKLCSSYRRNTRRCWKPSDAQWSIRFSSLSRVTVTNIKLLVGIPS